MNKREVEIALKSMNTDNTRIDYIDFLLKKESENTLAYLGFIKTIITHNKINPLESILEYIESCEKETKLRNNINK